MSRAISAAPASGFVHGKRCIATYSPRCSVPPLPGHDIAPYANARISPAANITRHVTLTLRKFLVRSEQFQHLTSFAPINQEGLSAIGSPLLIITLNVRRYSWSKRLPQKKSPAISPAGDPASDNSFRHK
ncbi:hypothetical protein HPB48_026735 [Haemaphysalis longicornis]|uniref:Uncharacterized protein n=1 Tax=Haemaphysalis longicornis TaxID=44386 RepID=A0A9J6HBI6_HAELO|nr:hypothetical protein HPB48_026735 [Haemaphysalis longicornis]